MRLQISCYFQFPLLGFLLCIVYWKWVKRGMGEDFQFPLLGFLLCINLHDDWGWRTGRCFQFPLLGFLLCIFFSFYNHIRECPWSFNSLYWDFCFASGLLGRATMRLPFSFNSLYWDFCFASIPRKFFWKCCEKCLSIPFIGIFALHHRGILRCRCVGSSHFQFPLLGFLLCIEEAKKEMLGRKALLFQFPLLGFLLCIMFDGFRGGTLKPNILSIPFIGIFALHLTRGNMRGWWVLR